MPQKTPISLITMPGWTLGVNRDADPYQLEVTESPDAENVDFGVRGRVSKRKGYAAWSKAAALTTAPRVMKTWKTLAGSERLFYVADDGTIHFGTGAPLADSTKDVGTWSLDEQFRVGVGTLNDLLYFTALNTSTIPRYDGSSWSSLTATIFDGTSGTFPKAQHLLTHVDRIFAANVDSNGTRLASRVHWSTALTPETWEATNFIDFDPDDGQQITAMRAFGPDIVIFKDHRIQLLTGKSEDSFSRFPLDSEIGTTAPGTIVPFSTMLYFFDPATGVHRFDGASIYPVDDAINQYLLDGQNRSQAHKAHAYIHEGKYYLSVAWGTDAYPSRTFVLDLTTGSWAEYTYGLQASAVFGNNNARLGGGVDGALGVFTMHSGLDDDGSAITAYFRTTWISPADTPSASHRMRRLDTVWEAIDDIDVTVSMFRDFSNTSFTYQQTIDTDPGGDLWGAGVWGVAKWGSPVSEVYSKTTGWGNQLWAAVQFEVRVAGVADDFALNRLTMVVSTRPRVRGE